MLTHLLLSDTLPPPRSTHTMSPPPQTMGSEYCTSTDIYSLGLVAMELFCVFETHMERAQANDATTHPT